MSDKKLTVEEFSRIQANYDSHYTYDGLSASHIGQLLKHITALEQELAQCQGELESASNHLDACYKALNHSPASSEPLSSVIYQLQRRNAEMGVALKDAMHSLTVTSHDCGNCGTCIPCRCKQALSTNAGKGWVKLSDAESIKALLNDCDATMECGPHKYSPIRQNLRLYITRLQTLIESSK